ncbi:class I SAM-dependent DNA methyltransferase [Phytomonospora endophytica]|uniref:SAM-dependent methyltransferase n=1 Tax=Phytomonospora endophytica TaxID=714109 RepID=A0A841FP37_9ACTN|nr:class I SAM-dependent methyltransferase [Phytomonospora endophytica]MBB6037594.1 SAM-dependent methyltransferase [Phytomonospora endophytica]GIG67880.1 methyltransferase [Phytomonospora endophytica]
MTEPADVTETRTAYDTVATDYAEILHDHLAGQPLDRAVLNLFAETVSGEVADVGCGPGRVTAYLDGVGVKAFGIDLSPGMIEVARSRYPGLRFEVGTMAGLSLGDGSLGGLVAWYSLIHTPPERHPEIFAEFARVVAPGGLLLVAFQSSEDERVRLEHAYGHDVEYDVYRLSLPRMVRELEAAGFEELWRTLRRPSDEPGYAKEQAYVCLRRRE